MRGSRLKPWNTKPISRLRTRASSRFDQRRDVAPVRAGSCPHVGRSRQPRRCMNVDLPEPDGPVSATNSPGSTSSVDAAQRVHLHLAQRRRSSSGRGRESDAARSSPASGRAGARCRLRAAAACRRRQQRRRRRRSRSSMPWRADVGHDAHLPADPPAIAVVVPSLTPVSHAIARRGSVREHAHPPAVRRAARRAAAGCRPARAGPAAASRQACSAQRSGGAEAQRRRRHRSTSSARAISMVTFAVMPGFSFRSGFGTSITVDVADDVLIDDRLQADLRHRAGEDLVRIGVDLERHRLAGADRARCRPRRCWRSPASRSGPAR